MQKKAEEEKKKKEEEQKRVEEKKKLAEDTAKTEVDAAAAPASIATAAATVTPETPQPTEASASPPPAPAALPPPLPKTYTGNFFKVLANMNVRESPDGASDPVTDITKNDVINVMAEEGDWFRISLRGRDDVWIKNKNSKKTLVEKLDPAVGGPIWEKQEIIARGEADPCLLYTSDAADE